MKSVLVIGLGRFGRHAATQYANLGCEVMAIDKDEAAINTVVDRVTSTQIGDCSDIEVLRSLGVNNFDICLVAIGSDFESSMIITVRLKDMGAPMVISMAGSAIHAQLLVRNGADEVVYPEREMAHYLAVRTTTNNVYDYLELTPEMGIFEISAKEKWRGKTIKELDFRNHYKISILLIKIKDNVFLPDADYTFNGDEKIMVMGN